MAAPPAARTGKGAGPRRIVLEVPREVVLLLLSSFCASLPIGMLLVFIPLYLHDLGMESVLVGGVFTLAGIGASLLLIAVGPAADRLGRRPFLLAGTALPMVGFGIFVLSTDPPWLVVASMLGGVGFAGGLGGGLVEATFNPTLAGAVPPRLRTTIMTWSEATWALAISLGALLAGGPALVARAGLLPPVVADRALFGLCLLLTAAATGFLLLLPRQAPAPPPAVAAPHAGGSGPVRTALPLILKLAGFFALQGAGLGLVIQLLPLWFALRFGVTADSIAPWFAAGQAAGLPVLALVPFLARRLGTARLILIVATGSAVLLLGLPLAPALPVAGVFYILRTALVAMQWPAQLSFLQGAVDPRLRSTATSVAMGSWSLANAVFPTPAGYLLDRHLLNWPLGLGVLCYGGAALVFWTFLRHTPLPEEGALGPARSAGSSIDIDNQGAAPELL